MKALGAVPDPSSRGQFHRTPAVSQGERAGHSRHLTGQALEAFLDEKLGIRDSYAETVSEKICTRSLLLPTAAGAPLLSPELLRSKGEEMPEDFTVASWEVCCYRLSNLITTLNEIYVAALHAEEFALGSDLLFWHQFTRVLKQVISRDQYLPALKYRELIPRDAKAKEAKKAKKAKPFAIEPAWEIVSETYEAAIERYAAAMPRVCAAGSVDAGEAGSFDLFENQSLLRHFSECLLHEIVTGTPLTAKLDQQIAQTLLYDCVYPYRPQSRSLTPGAALEQYRQWAAWRAKLTSAQTGAGFTLCFRLEEAPADDADNWQVQFLVASKRDASFKLSLAEFWALDPASRAGVLPYVGADFERNLLLALGYAARIEPKLWEGLETDRPSSLRLSLEEASEFLKESAWVLEDAGYTVIVPAWYTAEGRRRARVRLKTSARRGKAASPSGYFSLDGLVTYQYELSIGGETVSEAEWRQLVAAKAPLVQFRGQWMELDRDRTQHLLEFWQERQHNEPELTLQELLRAEAEGADDLEWDHDQAVQAMVARLQDKSVMTPIADPPALCGSLRDYQRRGVAWLRYLESLGLNPCLADDMGLGKTLEVIAHLLAERDDAQGELAPTLVIAPTSVVGNWQKEIGRFAPRLRVLPHHGSARIKNESAFRQACRESDVVITSFALARLDEKLLRGLEWGRVVVDEAQNIKNPQTAQARAVGKLPARHRLALTGTPVENRLLDLWSIFNFLNPGYLGKQAQFRKSFELPIQRDNDLARSATLKKLVEPFILRRLKTDPRIIDDLPEKVEQKMFCNLTAEQASLYEAVVNDASRQVDEVEGIERRGLILATLTKLKQVCNHPAQFLQDGSAFTSERSHKLRRLGEMLEEVIASGESALVFTQYAELGRALEAYVARNLHCTAYFLHGGTSAARREQMIAAFQDPESEPSVFILSLRAGGVGINLTRANHVFHFDRWWNPAVEDQATDRAFRIGQRKNVFVHKFVAIGTLEERIDQTIEDKKRISGTILGADESWLAELDNETFKDLIALQRSAVLE